MGWLSTNGPLVVWLVVLSFVFLECAFVVGLFLPGDSLLFTAGLVLAQQGTHDVQAWSLSIVATIVAVVGNQLGYVLGRRAGSSLTGRLGGRMLSVERLAKARDFLDRRGFWAIVLARWIPWIRTLAPLIAGAAAMDSRRYMTATATGAVLWVPTLVLLGYYGAGVLEQFPWLLTTVMVVGIVFFVAGTAWGIWRYRQEMRKPAQLVSATAD
ncbi:DedA family protein [Actinocrispum sp. NPDC049592]|uniref:DedA family protein n=1 Tax=Actinocrispum sp. NPDC049592 TaxID=3154835 RepID=UPI00341A538A